MKYRNHKAISLIIYAIILVAINTSSNFKLSLSSLPAQQLKEIPPLPSFSCQLSVFGIYNKTYQAKIEIISPTAKYFKIYFQTSSKCLTYNISQEQNIVQIQVNDTNFKDYNSITQTIYLGLSDNEQSTDDCNKIKDNGQKRSVYLIDKDNQNVYSYGIQLPQKSMLLTQILAYIVMLILSHNIKYRRFIPKKFGFLMAIVYSIFLFAVVYISTFVDNDLNIVYYCTMVVALIAITVYIIDIVSFFLENTILIYGSSIFISCFLIIMDMFIFPNAWFLNDIIAILLTGTCIKFVVIKKVKAAVLPLAFLWIFFIIRQFAIQFHIQNFQKALEIKLSPLHLQLPELFQDRQTGYSCSAFGTSKIIIIGLVINYAVRIDLYLSTKFYTILISIVSFVSLALQSMISIFFDEIPSIEFMSIIIFLPFSIILMLLFASKRGEWAEIWHGSFHDLAIDRKSVTRQSSQLTSESLGRNLDRLKMNASLLSD